MRLVISEFMSLDGVAQAPGGAKEDTDGGFANGGWSMPWFDPVVMGGAIAAAMADTEAFAVRSADLAGDGRGVARSGR